MIDRILLNYLRNEVAIDINSYNITTTITNVIGYDPMRWGWILSPPPGGVLEYSFWDQFAAQPRIEGGTTESAVVYTEDQIGGLVKFPINAKLVSGSGPTGLVTMGYTPQAKRILDDVIRHYISKLGTL